MTGKLTEGVGPSGGGPDKSHIGNEGGSGHEK